MKLSPQHIGAALGVTEKRTTVLEKEVLEMQVAMNFLKEIVQNALMKSNPEFKRNAVLSDMDNFLRKKIGREV